MKLREYLFGNENRPKTYTVVYDTFAGNESSFTNFNIHLPSWIFEYGECEIDHIEKPDRIYLDNWNMGGALKHGEVVRYGTTYVIEYSYGVHRYMLDVSGEQFYGVVDELSKEFEITKHETYREIEYYTINYYGDLDLIGIVHKGIDYNA